MNPCIISATERPLYDRSRPGRTRSSWAAWFRSSLPLSSPTTTSHPYAATLSSPIPATPVPPSSSDVRPSVTAEQEKPPKPRRTPPKGTVIGPDGKPCRVCSSWKDFAKSQVSKASGEAEEGQGGKRRATAMGPAAGGVAAFLAADAALANSTTEEHEGGSVRSELEELRETERRRRECPPDVEELGRSTWTFLHTTAAYFPDTPTNGQQRTMLGLITALSAFYPCDHCRTHLQEELERQGEEKLLQSVKSREAVAKWFCETHNEVNRRLGKPEFPCQIGKLDERWRDGPEDGRCD